jgi:hypothetical protein
MNVTGGCLQRNNKRVLKYQKTAGRPWRIQRRYKNENMKRLRGTLLDDI